MKAMVFAAGIGSRLKPITNDMPKALIPVNGKPMLEHIILKLKAAGFLHIVVNVHHYADQVIQFLQENNHFGLKIEISDERDYLLDTGGGLKHASKFLAGDEPFLVHNVDIFSNADLKTMYEYHLASKSLATLLVSNRSSSRQLLFDRKENLSGWQNTDTGEIKSAYPEFDPVKHIEFAFGGVHVISPKIFDLMDEWTGKFSIINFYLSICPKFPIQYYTTDNLQLIDIGKPETLAEANEWEREHSN